MKPNPDVELARKYGFEEDARSIDEIQRETYDEFVADGFAVAAPCPVAFGVPCKFTVRLGGGAYQCPRCSSSIEAVVAMQTRG